MSEMKALADAADAASRSHAPEDGVAAIAAAAADEGSSARRRRVRKADLNREERLLHNRTTAAESRKRKREMVVDLERSIEFFSRSNADLKNSNAELEREILLAKQRILAGETGLPTPAPAVNSSLLGLLKSSEPSEDEEQARAAHFAATQAMYKTMGFPPAAARQAASTFAAAYTAKLSSSASAAKPSPVSKVDRPAGATQNQAQAAHFAATQALYKSMGFPPRAAKEAAATFSRCHQPTNSSVSPAASAVAAAPSMTPASYIDSLNKFALQQAAAAKAAANAATAAMQIAKLHQGVMQAPAPVMQAPVASMMQALAMGLPQSPAFGGTGLSGLDNNQLGELLSKLRQFQR